ncbi:hypothetical protein Vadar_007998 [Vaccinium darrowii]|uniref:Uncharacterized protein n=1 Tax=Vaccinium darrowii TaxID=229202 RepID=A0ACB7YCL7_9ERIC|nr:hypothetical protein Vadar_007998 [Vaccinium darrowii]
MQWRTPLRDLICQIFTCWIAERELDARFYLIHIYGENDAQVFNIINEGEQGRLEEVDLGGLVAYRLQPSSIHPIRPSFEPFLFPQHHYPFLPYAPPLLPLFASYHHTIIADNDILDLEEGSGDTEVVNSLCLAGKIIHHKTLNTLAVANILRSAWKTRSEFSIVPWTNNVFLFRFEDEEDKKQVLADGPWSVMNNTLVLHLLEKGDMVANVDFIICHFWVQVHGLPLYKMTKANAETIGRRFNNLLAVKVTNEGLLLNRSFLRIKVEISLDSPLPRRIGHENKVCKFIKRDEGQYSGYGPEMKTGRAKNPIIPGAPLSQQVSQAENRLEELLRRRPPSLPRNGGAWNLCNIAEGVNTDPQANRTDVVETRPTKSLGLIGTTSTPRVTNQLTSGIDYTLSTVATSSPSLSIAEVGPSNPDSNPFSQCGSHSPTTK